MAEDERTVESVGDDAADGDERVGDSTDVGGEAVDEAVVDSTGDERVSDSNDADVGDESRVEADSASEIVADVATSRDRTPDEAAETFLDLDADLEAAAGAGAGSGDGCRRGLVVDADRVDASAVPAGYPLAVRTDQVVAITVDFGDESTTVYLAWPDDAEREVPLTWLLDAMDIELRDLYGRTVPVERVDGFETLLTPDERPRSDDRWFPAVVGGYALLAVSIVLLTPAGGLPAFLWSALTLLVLPYVTYRDAWYVRTHSDWTGGPLFWATLAMLPFFNLLTAVVYLWRRRQATFIDGDSSLRTRLGQSVRSLSR